MFLKKYIIIVFSIFIVSLPAKSQSVEYFVKASFIEKFARFTDWESNAASENFVICVLGKSPFHKELEELSRKTKIKEKSLKIIYLNDYHNISDCQVLFICSSETDNLDSIIGFLKNRNVLLVSDTPGFSQKGVHFNFFIARNGTIRFEINLKALVKSNLKTDMQLLSIGKIVD